MKLASVLCVLLLIFALNQSVHSTDILFEDLHNNFISDITQITGTELVVSADRSGRIVVQNLTDRSQKYVCEMGMQVYEMSHVEGTDLIMATIGNYKVYKINYKNGCQNSSITATNPLNLRRVTHSSVPTGSIYYYFIDRQLQRLQVLNIDTMTIVKGFSHNSIGYMMAAAEFGESKQVITAGDDRKLQIWNFDDTSAPVATIDDQTLTSTPSATSIWKLLWIEGTDFVVIAFNDGIAKVVNIVSRSLLSIFDKQKDSFGITKLQRIEGSNLLISFGFSLETVYVWDYRNPTNFRYKVDSYIHTNTGGSYIQGTGMICLVIPSNRGIVDFVQKYMCTRFCGSGEIYNFDWAQCSSASNCRIQNTTQQSLGFCQSCPVGTYFQGGTCVDCSQNCKMELCNQTTGICMENGCRSVLTCQANQFWNNATCQCQECTDPCNGCSNNSPVKVCSACKNSYNPPLCVSNCQNSTALINADLCIEQCPPRHYYDPQVFACKPCDFGCNVCTDFFTCLEGDTPSEEENPIQNCPAKQFYNGTTKSCQSCNTNCLTCTSSSQCSTCIGLLGFRFSRSIPLCNCPTGSYYEQGKNEEACCDNRCASCNYGNCLSCKASASPAIQRNVNDLCSCPIGSLDRISEGILDCFPCPTGCGVCTTTACSQCLREADGTQLRNLTNQCACNEGYYEKVELDGSRSCKPCISGCKQCSTNTDCTLCFGDLQYLDSTCKCRVGTFATPTNSTKCENCSQYCSTCTGSSACTACVGESGKTYSRVAQQVCECPDNHYNVPGQQNCALCSSNCSVCTKAQGCTTCKSPNRNLSNNCACNQGFFEKDGLCQACIADCLTCSDATTCSVCRGALTFLTAEGVCGCGLRTYRSLLQCLACPTYCKKCTNALNCTECETAERVPSSLCSCGTGFFQNGTQNSCAQCNYKCATCSSENVCLTCITGRNASNNCNCPQRFFENSAKTCTACLTGCQTCQNENSCDTCRQSATVPRQGANCVCPDGYFDDPTQQNCQKCPEGCATCSSATQCLSCLGQSGQPNSRDLSQRCACPTGFYSFAQQFSDCLTCNYKCNSCNSASSCLTCSHSLRVLANNCSCPVGYFEILNTAACGKCNDQCISCTGANSCQSCIGSANSNRNSSNGCKCNEGYFDDGVSQDCKKCNSLCKTCNGNANNCVECIGSTGKPSSRILTAGCVCPAGFTSLFETDSRIQECQKPETCLSVCATCSNSYSCSTCFDSNLKKLRIPAELCRCPDGFYSASQTEDCKTCPSTCKTCSNGQTCLTCISPSIRLRVMSTRTVQRVLPDCQCPPGYFSDPATQLCVQCPAKCKTCSDSTTCDICSETIRDPLTCECPPGYYDNNGVCQQCASNKCLKCGSDLQCTICVQDLDQLRVAPACGCPVGSYYEDFTNNKNCIKIENCTNPLCTCPTAPGTCSACIGANRQLSNACRCVDGYFDLFTMTNPNVNKDCLRCDAKCQTCTHSATKCLTCVDPNSVLPNCECKTGYKLSNSGQCVKIDCSAKIVGCEVCGSEDECLKCQNTALSLPSCRCPASQIQEPSTLECLPCPSKCGSCNTSLMCLSCSDKFTTLESLCESCQIGYKKDANGVCVKQACAAGLEDKCGICDEKGDCLECIVRERLLPGCDCKAGTYLKDGQCLECSSNCLDCSGSAQNCGTCSDKNLERVPPNCECPKGKFSAQPLTGFCVACDSKCESCSGQIDNCISCAGNNRQPPACGCLEGYEESSEINNADCLKIGENGYPEFLPEDFDEGEDGEGPSMPYAAQITVGVVTVYSATFAMVPAVKSIGSGASMLSNVANVNQVIPNVNPVAQPNIPSYNPVSQVNGVQNIQRIQDVQNASRGLKIPKKMKLNPIGQV